MCEYCDARMQRAEVIEHSCTAHLKQLNRDYLEEIVSLKAKMELLETQNAALIAENEQLKS